jgi:hypothetical protein
MVHVRRNGVAFDDEAHASGPAVRLTNGSAATGRMGSSRLDAGLGR